MTITTSARGGGYTAFLYKVLNAVDIFFFFSGYRELADLL